MERMTMAQAVGEEPIRDAGWTSEDVDEFFGDMDAAREHFAHERRKDAQHE